jgi:hypothetical protein
MSTLYQSYINFNAEYMVYTHFILEKKMGLGFFVRKFIHLCPIFVVFAPDTI